MEEMGFIFTEVVNNLILQLDDKSNVCVPGKYAFKIDRENVQPGRCVDIEPGIIIILIFSIYVKEYMIKNMEN